MNIESINKVLNNDASEILVANWKSLKAIILIIYSIVLIALPIMIAAYTEFGQVLWIPIGAIIYGIYLGFKEEVVFYANNKEVWNILGMGVVPIAPLIIGSSFMPEYFDPLISTIVIVFTVISTFLVFLWFAIRCSNAVILMNDGINLTKLVCVFISKIFLVFLFTFVMLANLNRTMSDKPGEMEKGLLLLGIVGALGTWIYNKLCNTRQVFQNRDNII